MPIPKILLFPCPHMDHVQNMNTNSKGRNSPCPHLSPYPLPSPAQGSWVFFLLPTLAPRPWSGMGAVQLKNKLCWDAVMAELIHQLGGPTRSNLGGRIADESFSNQEDLGNFSCLSTSLMSLPIQELGWGGCHGQGKGFKQESFVCRKQLQICWIIINCWTL